MLTFNTSAKDSLKVIKKSKIWRAFNMLMVGFAWQRVRNKTGIKVEKSWINYVKWPASKMGRLTKTWHLPRPQSNGIDLKGEPKIYISLNLFAKFYLITFYAGLPWNNTRMNLSESILENLKICCDFKPPLVPLIKVWSAAWWWRGIIRLNFTPEMAPIAMITTVKTDLKDQPGSNLAETSYLKQFEWEQWKKRWDVKNIDWQRINRWPWSHILCFFTRDENPSPSPC